MSDSGQGAPISQLREIVDLAIAREQEAVDFYSDLAARVKTPAIAEELRRIAAMEVEHRERLKNLDVSQASAQARKPAADLKIVDYLVEIEPAPEMTWQEVLRVAMQREVASMKLYGDLAAVVSNPTLRHLFENLAAAESDHKLYFERVWDEEVLIEN